MSEVAQIERKGTTKGKQEIIDQVGRITTKLYERAKNLPQAKRQHVDVRHNGSLVAPIFYNLSQEDHKAVVGEDGKTKLHISTNPGNGERASIYVRTEHPDGSETTHKANAREDWYAPKDGFSRGSTETMNITGEGDDQQYEHQSVFAQSTPKENWWEQGLNEELHTYTPGLGFRSDSDKLLGRVNEDKDIPEALSQRATSQAAETLAAIRGTIAQAEIDAHNKK